MPIYKKTIKAEVRVIIQSSKPIPTVEVVKTILELENISNLNGQLIKIVDGAHINALARLHLKELIR